MSPTTSSAPKTFSENRRKQREPFRKKKHLLLSWTYFRLSIDVKSTCCFLPSLRPFAERVAPVLTWTKTASVVICSVSTPNYWPRFVSCVCFRCPTPPVLICSFSMPNSWQRFLSCVFPNAERPRHSCASKKYLISRDREEPRWYCCPRLLSSFTNRAPLLYVNFDQSALADVFCYFPMPNHWTYLFDPNASTTLMLPQTFALLQGCDAAHFRDARYGRSQPKPWRRQRGIGAHISLQHFLGGWWAAGTRRSLEVQSILAPPAPLCLPGRWKPDLLRRGNAGMRDP